MVSRSKDAIFAHDAHAKKRVAATHTHALSGTGVKGSRKTGDHASQRMRSLGKGDRHIPVLGLSARQRQDVPEDQKFSGRNSVALILACFSGTCT